jgi:hypothetical protein
MVNSQRRSRNAQNQNRQNRQSLRRGGAPFTARVETEAERKARVQAKINDLVAKLGPKVYLKDGVTECAALRHLRDELAGQKVQLFKQEFRPDGCKVNVHPPRGSRKNGTTTCVAASAAENDPKNCMVNPASNRCKRV